MSDRRVEKGETTRNNIVHAAIAMIANHGVNELSAEKLSRAIGISKSTIFHHFNTTDELLVCTLHTVFTELQQSMGLGEFKDIEHFLDAIGENLFQLRDSELIYVRSFLSFFLGGLFNSVLRNELISYADKMNDLFYKIFLQLAPESVTPEAIESASLLLLPMIDGIGFHYLLNQNREKCQRIWKEQSKGILYLLTHPE